MKLLDTLANMFRIPDLRKRIFFTLGLLAVYRFGGHIPTPGIDANRLAEFFQQNSGSLFGFIDLFSGGMFRRLTIFALGIMPYITSSIILQLLTVVVPTLEKLQKEGGGFVLNPGVGFITMTIITLTAGTTFIMWLGEQITERGIGNGMSLLIFTGIVVG